MQRASTSDPLLVLHIVTRRLAEAGIRYMLTGSVAMSYYAEPRMTRDADIVIDLTPDRADELVALFAQDFYIDEQAAREAVTRGSIVNIIHMELVEKVDLIISKSTEYARVAMQRRRQASIGGEGVSIISPEDLILSNLSWARAGGSETQIEDVRNLLRSVADLDISYLEQWLVRLGLGSRWEEVKT
jgi:hypothetical protein